MRNVRKIINLLLFDIQESANELFDFCNKENIEHSNDGALLKAQITALNSEIRKGTNSFNDSSQEKNRIVDSLLSLINIIEKELQSNKYASIPQNLTPLIWQIRVKFILSYKQYFYGRFFLF